MRRDGLFRDFRALLPAPLISVAKTPGRRGHRVRARWQHKRAVQLAANRMVRVCNSLDTGLRNRKTRTTRSLDDESLRLGGNWKMAVQQFHGRAMTAAALTVQARLGVDFVNVTGAQMAAKVVKADFIDRYTMKSKGHNQVPFKADLLDEPAANWPTVNMFQALPMRESMFYSNEENVVSMAGKSQDFFAEFQKRFGFVGGSYDEYVRYHSRLDYDQTLWEYALADKVKGVAGFSAVSKKNGRQRKLLMQVPTNYAWVNVNDRSELGMQGGAAFSSVYVPGGRAFMSAWDQSNAFSAVATPPWMWGWVATPPLRCGDIWDKVSPDVRALAGKSGWIYPLYKRLAMGSSHSVHVLMSINLHDIGRTIYNYTMTGGCGFFKEKNAERADADVMGAGSETSTACDDNDFFDVLSDDDDAAWDAARGSAGLMPPPGLVDFIHLTMGEADELLRDLKRQDKRTLTVLHAFSGARRSGDLHEAVVQAMKSRNCPVVVISGDYGNGADWDLAEPANFHRVMGWIQEGLLDALAGGPPLLHLVAPALPAGGAAAPALQVAAVGTGRRDSPGIRADQAGQHGDGQLPLDGRGAERAGRGAPAGAPRRPRAGTVPLDLGHRAMPRHGGGHGGQAVPAGPVRLRRTSAEADVLVAYHPRLPGRRAAMRRPAQALARPGPEGERRVPQPAPVSVSTGDVHVDRGAPRGALALDAKDRARSNWVAANRDGDQGHHQLVHWLVREGRERLHHPQRGWRSRQQVPGGAWKGCHVLARRRRRDPGGLSRGVQRVASPHSGRLRGVRLHRARPP